MSTIPQRLREIAKELQSEVLSPRSWARADKLIEVAAELEAPAADAVPVVAWELRDSLGYVGIEYDSSAAGAAEKDGWEIVPLIRQRDYLATVALLQARINALESRQWQPLTDEDRTRAFQSLPDMLDGFMKSWGWLHFAKAVEAICREKNAQPDTSKEQL